MNRMKIAATFLAAASALALVACGSGERSEGENVQAVYDDKADTLDNAADVSLPAAQPALENAADDLRDRGENAQEAIDK
jgi:ABC-type oligopeptide transport system substrate-binding subunit